MSDRPPSPPIDPRFRLRIIELRRRQGRRRLRAIAGAASAAMLLTAGWGATRSSLLDVDHVRLTGATHTQPLQVIETAGTLPGRAMLDLDEAAAAERIERLPWVADATVRRRWPNTVSIALHERAPVASARAAGGGWALVDGRGRVLERAPGALADRPALEGVPAVGEAGTRVPASTRVAAALAAALPATLRRGVETVVRGSDGAMVLRLRGGGVVRLGAADSIAPKLVAAETVLARVDGAGEHGAGEHGAGEHGAGEHGAGEHGAGDNRAVGVLDVSDPLRPVLTRR